MKISTIHIENFRLLKNFSVDLEDGLSLVIGKNNTGKTSFLTFLDRILGPSESKFKYDDFNLELREQIIGFLEGELPNEDVYSPLGIRARIQIDYEDSDNLAEVSKLIMSLDPDDRTIVLEFRYDLDYRALKILRQQFEAEKQDYTNTCSYLHENLTSHIPPITIRSLSSSDNSVWIDLKKENIKLDSIIGFQFVSARRDVTNREHDKTLSSQTSQIYKKATESEQHKAAVNDFKSELRKTDKDLSLIYETLFSDVVGKIKKFGGVKADDTLIHIVSTLQHKQLLEGNTTVTYKQGAHDLPEHYNGLGYMNLISMIFEIEVLTNNLKKEVGQSPAPINLLFIEEPEAHTHPQMQYVFIKNIKNLLHDSRNKADGTRIHLQSVISTHSSHIVAESDFEDIKYLFRVAPNSVESKNLKSLEQKYAANQKDRAHYRFLKQYLTLSRAEVFFADKIIMVEGDTERILIPAMMKKIDQENGAGDERPLLSQNVSVIEVGAHSKIFEHFIDFLGVRTLIITDIDSGYKEEIPESNPPKIEQHTCKPNDAKAQFTTNDSLVHFHGKQRSDLAYFVGLNSSQKSLKKNGKSWEQADDGCVYLAYQTAEDGYHARSFEDAFFNLNQELLRNKGHDSFQSLTKKWFDFYLADNDHFRFSENGVGSKPSLAIEILMNSESAGELEFSNWSIPEYIKEGLIWLRKD
jgi:predicted ATP-dependent endonuclease of OLD family